MFLAIKFSMNYLPYHLLLFYGLELFLYCRAGKYTQWGRSSKSRNTYSEESVTPVNRSISDCNNCVDFYKFPNYQHAILILKKQYEQSYRTLSHYAVPK